MHSLWTTPAICISRSATDAGVSHARYCKPPCFLTSIWETVSSWIRPHLIVGLALGVEVAAALATAHWQRRQAVLQDLYQARRLLLGPRHN